MAMTAAVASIYIKSYFIFALYTQILFLSSDCNGSIALQHPALKSMYMPYTTYPLQPRVRRDAVRLVKYRDWSMRKVARHIGVEPSTISRWVKLDPTGGWQLIPTKSSRPNNHPNETPREIVRRILEIRSERHQCAEIIHHRLMQEDIIISLSTVKRTLKRCGISKFSKWKKWHQYPPRPMPERPGILVQIDTMLDGPPDDRLSAYALVDVNSRWAYAEPVDKVNGYRSLQFVMRAENAAPFSFDMLQSDHGGEFSKWFTKQMLFRKIDHRHSRVRKPTDNGHIERFIRTLQDECLNRITRTFSSWQKEIPQFIHYYNNERPHMALEMKTPQQVLRSC